MSRFHTFINEVEVRESKLGEFFDKFLSPLAKKLGVNFSVRFGGKNHTEKFVKEDGNTGVGYSFVIGDGRIIRFNFNKGKMATLSSIDIWKNLKTPGQPTKSIIIPDGLNYLQALDKIAFEMGSVKGSISEASKAEREAVNKKLSATFGLDTDKANTLRKRLDSIEEIIGVKGLADQTSTWLTTIRGAESLTKSTTKISGADKYRHLEKLIKVITSNPRSKSLLVLGQAGVGKTHEVTTRVKAALGEKGDRWNINAGKASPLGLYQFLFINRDKEILIFDDCDSVFNNEDAVNILKAALDSQEGPRTISWISPRTKDFSKLSVKEREMEFERIDAEVANGVDTKFPNAFQFGGRIIFISNLSESKVDDAVKSRAFTIDITLERAEISDRIESILPKICPNTSMGVKKEVFEYFKNSQTNKQFSIRMFVNTVLLAESLPNGEWKELVDYA